MSRIMDDLKLKEYVKFQIDRGVISLYKRYFEMIEDLHKDHLLLLEKVKEKTSEDFVKNIDYFDTNKYNYIRKKILDAGNDTIRTIDTNLKSINVTLK
jgi:hypothetical protein